VLPPIDTSDWQASTINKHVAEVRDQFLRALNQIEEPRAVQDPPQNAAESAIGAEDEDESPIRKWNNVVLGSWE
jgi:hypothetical protein